MVGLEVLRRSELFEGLSDDELAELAKLAREEEQQAGSVVFRENDPARNLYFVREGRVALLVEFRRGKQTVIDTISRNGSFGWSAMVPPYTYTSAARAMEPSRLIVISGQDLREFCHSHCGTCYSVMEKIAAIASRRLKDTRLQLISLLHT